MISVKKYQKKPVVIEAVEVMGDYDELCEIVRWCNGRAVGEEISDRAVVAIDTLEGTMYADWGDYIIKGIQGEFYPCKPEIFSASYQEVVL